MSHFSVLVIGDNIEEQLAPYDENIEVPEYQDELVSAYDMYRFIQSYTTLEEDKHYGPKTEKEVEENKKLTFEQLYEKYGDNWNSNSWRKNNEGLWAEFSTYNPKSKWDWYSIGGRWSGQFKLKEGCKGEIGEPGCYEGVFPEKMAEYKEKMTKFVDAAKKGDIDWDYRDPKQAEECKRFWEICIEGQPPLNEEEKDYKTFYKKEYYLDRYKTKEEYIKRITQFGSHAVVKDGKWYEVGEMGWFGCSSETNEEQEKWDNEYFELFIKDLPEDTQLTVVDCHI